MVIHGLDYTWPTFHAHCADDKEKSKHFLKIWPLKQTIDSKSLASARAIFLKILKIYFQVQVCNSPWPRLQTILGPHFTRIVLMTRKN